MACATDGDELTYAAASALKGLASWSTGDLSSARQAYLVATNALAAQGHVSDALGCTVTVVELELQLGNLDAAHGAAQRALDLAAGVGDEVVRGTADMWVALARVAWERGNSEGAARHLGVAGDLGEAAGLPQQPYRWRVAMAALRETQGDLAAANVLLEEAERLFNSDFSPNVRPLSAVRARLHLRIGDLAAARRWAAAAQVAVAVGDDLAYLREYEHVTFARLLLAEHAATRDPTRVAQALTMLQRLHAAAADGGRTAAVVETSLLLALAYNTVGRPEDALRRLRDAVELTGHRGWVRPLLDAGPRIVDLLGLVPGQAHLKHVLTAAATGSRPADAPRSPTSTTPGEGAPLVAPLSSRELDVLRLLGSDLDGPAIARHLNVSLPTVRTHTQRIYAKLGVNNRRAAVRRAHQLHF